MIDAISLTYEAVSSTPFAHSIYLFIIGFHFALSPLFLFRIFTFNLFIIWQMIHMPVDKGGNGVVTFQQLKEEGVCFSSTNYKAFSLSYH